MNNSIFAEMIVAALVKLSIVFPEHCPWKGHLKGDAREKSRFFISEIPTILSFKSHLADMLGTSELKNVYKGNGDAVILIFDAHSKVGLESKNLIVADKSYNIEKIHGSLQARGEGELTISDTTMFTVVLTPERMKDGSTDYVLASIYPGEPDPIANWEGLSEGDVVAGSDLIARQIIRCC